MEKATSEEGPILPPQAKGIQNPQEATQLMGWHTEQAQDIDAASVHTSPSEAAMMEKIRREMIDEDKPEIYKIYEPAVWETGAHARIHHKGSCTNNPKGREIAAKIENWRIDAARARYEGISANHDISPIKQGSEKDIDEAIADIGEKPWWY